MTVETGGKPMDNLELYPAADRKILAAINNIRGVGGESYAKRGLSEKARRNPVKEDTAPLLTALTAMHKPKVILELGTAYGYSALHLALGAPHALLYTVEYEEPVALRARGVFDSAGIAPVIMTGDAGEILNGWDGMLKVDLVFFDHDKKQYLPHFKAIEPHLSDGALIVADNVNDRREECGDFVSYVSEKYPARIMPTEAGLLVAQK